ncbi:MAG TPA: chromosomal replication initiator protein DnaA [Caulobacteraceae bacterium]|nr:chromosomal replication initiator protein DnaA [Caulobacteraceae bacterium]
MARVSVSGPVIWDKTSCALRSELGEGAFGSWLARAVLKAGADGSLCLVTPTGVARDWVRRYAWRRIEELWAAHDPDCRSLSLKSRAEFDASPLVVEQVAESPPMAAAAMVGAPRAARERFTFENFVVGPANEFAYAVARRVASWDDGHFNPVLVHGPYGFGKTHLLCAMAREAMAAAPDRKVMYLTSERFLSSFVRAAMERRLTPFKDELRSADLLIIDDVHFIGGKQSTQEELFHSLAALMEDGRRVVFSADRPPAALTEFDAHLRSHLAAGLVCGIDPADRALRMGILERKIELLRDQFGLSGGLRPEVAAFLADRFTDNVRELEGALNTLIARSGPTVGDLSLDEAQRQLRSHLRGGEKRVTVDDIQKATAEHFRLKQADLLSERRTRALARPRQVAMWLTKQLTTRSLPDIGRRFGGRDHTTVLHAVRRIDALRPVDPQLAQDLEILMRRLRG